MVFGHAPSLTRFGQDNINRKRIKVAVELSTKQLPIEQLSTPIIPMLFTKDEYLGRIKDMKTGEWHWIVPPLDQKDPPPGTLLVNHLNLTLRFKDGPKIRLRRLTPTNNANWWISGDNPD